MATSDVDANGLALLDEFLDCLAALVCNPGDVDIPLIDRAQTLARRISLPVSARAAGM